MWSDFILWQVFSDAWKRQVQDVTDPVEDLKRLVIEASTEASRDGATCGFFHPHVWSKWATGFGEKAMVQPNFQMRGCHRCGLIQCRKIHVPR